MGGMVGPAQEASFAGGERKRHGDIQLWGTLRVSGILKGLAPLKLGMRPTQTRGGAKPTPDPY